MPQLAYILLGVALGILLPRVGIGFTVSGPAASRMLAAMAGGLTAFITVVYTLLFVVVQFGSITFGQRLNLFHASPFVWNAFGLFTGAAVFAITASLAVGSAAQTSGLVPIVTILLLVSAVAVLRELMARALASLRLSSVLQQISAQGRNVISGVYPDPVTTAPRESAARPAGAGSDVHWPGSTAVLQVVDVRSLIRSAVASDGVVVLHRQVGDVLQTHDVVAGVYGDADALTDAVLSSLGSGQERTFEQDPAFAFRVLADIGLRALSPAINDPTTAVQVIDAIDGLLRMIALRDLEVGEVRVDGTFRVAFMVPTWEDYVALAVDELMETAVSSAVRRRLETLLRDLIELVPEDRRPPLRARLSISRPAVPSA